MADNAATILQALPKAELHVHFEGTIDLKTLFVLAERNNISLNAPTRLLGFQEFAAPDEKFFGTPFRGTFSDFIRYYLKVSSCLRTVSDFVLVGERYARLLHEENTRAVEIYLTPTTHFALGTTKEILAQSLAEVTLILKEQGDAQVSWIFDIVRNSKLSGDETLEVACEFRDLGIPIRALGLAGQEIGFPVAPFSSVLNDAKARGFNVYVHAGETGGEGSVWEAIQTVEVDRIGHGVQAINDARLMAELKSRNITLEVSPWSNIALGVYTAENHPLKDLIRHRVPVVISSDDPGIFGKSLSDNFLLAHELGVSIKDLQIAAERSLSLGRK